MAENFSLYSTCSGIKSTSGLASLAAVTAASSTVEPMVTVTAPSACLASLPVSMVIVRPSGRVIVLLTGLIIKIV